MQTLPTLPNPAEQLATIVTKLYELAGRSDIDQKSSQQLLLKAHDLRGDLITLVSTQFTNDSAAYQNAMNNITTVTSTITEAEKNIQKAINTVQAVGQLATSIDSLLKEAVAIAAKV